MILHTKHRFLRPYHLAELFTKELNDGVLQIPVQQSCRKPLFDHLALVRSLCNQITLLSSSFHRAYHGKAQLLRSHCLFGEEVMTPVAHRRDCCLHITVSSDHDRGNILVEVTGLNMR